MSNRRTLPKVLTIRALLIATLALAAAAGAWAQGKSNQSESKEESPGVRGGPHVRTFHFSTHTLSAGQTARLTVVNPVLLSPPDPVRERGVVPCVRVRLAFDVYALDARINGGGAYDGETDPPDPIRLRFVRRVERVAELEPGEGATFEYTASAGEIVSPVTFVNEREAEPPEPVRASVITSLEVRKDGATLFVLPGTLRGFNPQPDPPRER